MGPVPIKTERECKCAGIQTCYFLRGLPVADIADGKELISALVGCSSC